MQCFVVLQVILPQVTPVVLDVGEGEDKAVGNNSSVYQPFIVQMIETSFKIFYSASWIRMGGINRWNKKELLLA